MVCVPRFALWSFLLFSLMVSSPLKAASSIKCWPSHNGEELCFIHQFFDAKVLDLEHFERLTGEDLQLLAQESYDRLRDYGPFSYMGAREDSNTVVNRLRFRDSDRGKVLDLGYSSFWGRSFSIYESNGYHLRKVWAWDAGKAAKVPWDEAFPVYRTRVPESGDIYFLTFSEPIPSLLPVQVVGPTTLANLKNYESEIRIGFSFAMIVMFLYNFSTYLFMRSREYLFYSAYVLSALVLILTLNFYEILRFLIVVCKLDLAEQAYEILIVIPVGFAFYASGFFLIFNCELSDIRTWSPRLGNYLRGFGYAVLAMGSLALILNAFGKFGGLALLLANQSTAISFSVVLILWLYRAIVRQDRIAYMALPAIGIYCIDVVYYVQYNSGLIAPTFNAKMGLNFGALVETAFLSIVLSYKTRSRENAYRREIDSLNGNLKVLNEDLETKVMERTADVRSIMDSIQQGIIMVEVRGDELILGQEYSRFAEALFRKSPAGLSLSGFIFQPAHFSKSSMASFEMAVKATIGSDLEFASSNLDQLPTQLTYDLDDGQQKFLELSWDCIQRNNEVGKVLLSIKDVTDERMNKAKLKKQEATMEIIMAAVTCGKKVTLAILDDLLHIVQEVERARLQGADALSLLKRHVHTAKGLAMTAGFKHLTSILHRMEEQSSQQMLELEFSATLRETVTELCTLIQENLSWDVQHGSLEHLTLRELLNLPMEGLFQAADELGKAHPLVKITGEELVLTHRAAKALREVLMHLFRNAIDHGIESEEERERTGKSLRGTLRVEALSDRGKTRIRISDDGRGLNVRKIKAKSGLQDISEAIFAKGFSTKDDVSVISGRGIGMDAARQALRELDGEIMLNLLGQENADGFVNFEFELCV